MRVFIFPQLQTFNLIINITWKWLIIDRTSQYTSVIIEYSIHRINVIIREYKYDIYDIDILDSSSRYPQCKYLNITPADLGNVINLLICQTITCEIMSNYYIKSYPIDVNKPKMYFILLK